MNGMLYSLALFGRITWNREKAGLADIIGAFDCCIKFKALLDEQTATYIVGATLN